jgi:hypothetical protein
MKTMAADVSGGHHHQLAGLGWAAAFADTFPLSSRRDQQDQYNKN